MEVPHKGSEMPSMRETLSAPLNELDSLAQALLLSLAPYAARPPPTPPTSAFLECDASIAAALHLARQHQSRQRRIESLKKDVIDLDGKLREIYHELEMGRREISDIVEEGSKRQEEIARAAEGAVPYESLLAYASILSSFTSAPPSSLDPQGPDQAALANFKPPFPTEEMMRKGRLHAGTPLSMMGRTKDVGEPPTPPVVLPQNPPQPTRQNERGDNQYRQDYHYQQTSQPVDDIFDLDLNPDED